MTTNRTAVRNTVTADTVVRCDPAALWELTQTPAQHVRWDARFTDIQYLPKAPAENVQRFRYATRLGFGLNVEGWGETVGENNGSGSALRFGSDDPRSLIREGAGCWTYRSVGDDGAAGEAQTATRFATAFDYRVRYGPLGRVLDRLAFRPLMQWATRWSFDRLRLWVERGLEPETALRLWLAKVVARTALALVWIYEGLVPKLLFTTQAEIELVARSHLYWPTPRATLFALAVGEILGGIWLLTGRGERAASVISLALLVGIGTLCAVLEPGLLHHPFGGISKNLGLIACALVVLLLSGAAPKASRANGRRPRP
jgi:uncharacterized membrane protein YphA (DoxX/SURF4 family)